MGRTGDDGGRRTPDPSDGSDTSEATGWEPLIEALEERRDRARAMGGAERLERLVYGRGKRDARQRIARLFDPGSFTEIGALVGAGNAPADALVAGAGRIHGRPALAGAEDFSVLGGSIGRGSMAKRFRLCELALQEKIPLLMMLDGAGHRIASEREAAPTRVPNDLLALADLSGQVPMVCLVLGASAGHGALASSLSDFTIMTRRAALFSGGPPLVKAATGEEVSVEELGGAVVCTEVAGTAHNRVEDDDEAIALARRYLEYFPSNRWEPPPRRDGPDCGPRALGEILRMLPPNAREPYDVHPLIELLVDEGRFLEIQPRYGASLVTALAFLGGRSVAIVANNPGVRAGAVDAPAAIKATDFIETAGSFRLPLVFLADNPGVMAGRRAEREGILKWAGRMFQAQRRVPSPKLHVTLRKSFGFGASSMAQNPFDRQTLSLALPGVTMDAMPATGGARSAGLDADAQALLEERQRSGPWGLAEGLVYDDVIDPRELRNALIAGLVLSEGRERAESAPD